MFKLLCVVKCVRAGMEGFELMPRPERRSAQPRSRDHDGWRNERAVIAGNVPSRQALGTRHGLGTLAVALARLLWCGLYRYR